MKRKGITIVSLLLCGTCLTVGSVFAAYAITDNAEPFGVQISISSDSKTITFHTPNGGDSSCMAYSTTEEHIDYGAALNTISIPSTSPFSGFTFQGWYKESTFVNQVLESDTISENLDLYAKYTRSNVLFDGNDTYFMSSDSDQTVNSQYVYKVANQTWGIQYVLNNADKLDLLSASGIYKMTYSTTDWTILRKVGIHANGLTWLAGDGALMYAYGQDSDTGSWGDCYWGGTLSGGISLDGGTAKGTVYVDYTKPYIGVVRDDDNAALNSETNRPFNSWKPASLSSGYGYSKDNIYLYLTNTSGDHKKDAPSWGNGN